MLDWKWQIYKWENVNSTNENFNILIRGRKKDVWNEASVQWSENQNMISPAYVKMETKTETERESPSNVKSHPT